MEYFGTDGIRGVANTHPMTPEFALRLGRATCRVMSRFSDKKTVIIGMDTRRSCKMIESALLSGILSEGYNCALLGVIPTPGVAYLARKMDAAFAIMISASHNPYYDNGIKFFSHEGFKLKKEIEEEIEKNIPQRGNEQKQPDKVGRLLDFYEGFPPLSIYINHLINNYWGGEITNKQVIIDCSNGSASSIARPILYKVAPDCEIMHDAPNGVNINENCGSTKMKTLINNVKNEEKSTIGIAFDGDADRVLMVDEDGELVDGDELIAIIAKYLKECGKLSGNKVVVTVMSNLGFFKAMEREKIDVEVTQVGDRYVLHRMIETGAMIGGEQSGHIILSNYNTTGDGFQTALTILSIMSETGKELKELKKVMKKYPQVLKNARIKDKSLWLENKELQEEIQEMEKELKGNGRLLVRPSGTEPLIRVMVEGEDIEFLEDLTNRAIEKIIKKIGV